ncbi:hypothetical protein TNCV_5062521 [Trichonephila clavipes]|nr:hypothetical protein TNCV_5062521 [Trichonephila clavipes]
MMCFASKIKTPAVFSGARCYATRFVRRDGYREFSREAGCRKGLRCCWDAWKQRSFISRRRGGDSRNPLRRPIITFCACMIHAEGGARKNASPLPFRRSRGAKNHTRRVLFSKVPWERKKWSFCWTVVGKDFLKRVRRIYLPKSE